MHIYQDVHKSIALCSTILKLNHLEASRHLSNATFLNRPFNVLGLVIVLDGLYPNL